MNVHLINEICQWLCIIIIFIMAYARTSLTDKAMQYFMDHHKEI